MEDWRSWSRETLDAAYDNVGAIADAAALVAECRQRSDAFYATHVDARDRRYGPAPRQRYDLFRHPDPDASTFVFIHGGYWQGRDKEDFAFVARGPLDLGMHVVLAEYTLGPDATMTEIVAEIGTLLDVLQADGHRRIVLSGHSAGGHLAAMWRDHPAVTRALPVSGLFDLAPIAAGRLNDRLSITPDEIAACSPIHRIGSGAPMVVTVGDAELPELVRHSRDYADACRRAGECVAMVPVPGANHFSILFDLAGRRGVQLLALMDTMASDPC